MQLRICVLERELLDTVRHKLDLMFETWGRWRVSRDDRHVLLINDDAALERFQALQSERSGQMDELKQLNRRLFSRR